MAPRGGRETGIDADENDGQASGDDVRKRVARILHDQVSCAYGSGRASDARRSPCSLRPLRPACEYGIKLDTIRIKPNFGDIEGNEVAYGDIRPAA